MRKGEWNDGVSGTDSVRDLMIKTISGHAYRVAFAHCHYRYNLRTDVPYFTLEDDIDDFRSDIVDSIVYQDGERVDFDALPEQERTEIGAVVSVVALTALNRHLYKWWPNEGPYRRAS